MGKKRTKMGRPPLPVAKKRSYRATVRLTAEHYRWLTRGAKKEGLTLSAYIMKLLEKQR
jgi:hypothetical protein